MIICGYQGIGKSTVAGRNNIIDLESGNFWHKGQRPDNWYVYYCNIAEHLSRQGYIVLLSSHKVVRDRLRKYCNEPVRLIFPSIFLAEEWKHKLCARYQSTKSEKDFKAWQNAEERYHENIAELLRCGIPSYEITDMDYRLSDIIDYLVAENQWEF